MKICEITEWLEKHYTCAAAEDWDNVGLLVGEDEKPVEKVMLALDATEEVVAEACENNVDLLITHHPMIFGGIKKINNHNSTGRKVLKLIQQDVAYYAMHTNYDILGMADLSAEYLQLNETEVLHITGDEQGRFQGFGRVGNLSGEMTLLECGRLVKELLHLPDVRIYGDPQKMVHRAAVCTGSGKSFLADVKRANADVYVTGDIDHHTGLDAVEDGLCIIDAGHYGTEYIFAEAMRRDLMEAFPNLTVLCAKMHPPYQVL
ncbi:MAG: Nif3-like dinuclear metal center hexameric protein [Eubacteriales bacterium]|nr:Nif3-like dinuclear metal center hexameric protein [Eubacteriales bacterium]